VGVCSDPTVDDAAFIEKVVRDLPKRLDNKSGLVRRCRRQGQLVTCVPGWASNAVTQDW
jgi:hypothetical protein